MYKNKRTIFLVDMQSFYASVEVASNLSLMGKPVVVCGNPKKRHGIALAATPEAKETGIKTGMPAWQVKNHCPEAIFVQPHMNKYIDASLQISEILNQFTDKVEVFSIDEQFLDVTNTVSLFGSIEHMVKIIQHRIWNEVGVKAKVGVGENKIQAKMACDNFAKKTKNGVFTLNDKNYKERTGPLTIDSLFGVGNRMKQNLERIGIYTIADLNNRSVEEMKKRWGVQGHVLWLCAQGIDYSPVENDSTNFYKGVGNSITLPRDYVVKEDIEVVLLELTEEVCRRVRAMSKRGKTVNVSVRGADFSAPSGFNRQTTLNMASDDTIEIYRTVLKIFLKYWNGEPVRSIGVNLNKLENSDEIQLDLFTDVIKKKQVGMIMDEIKEDYGKTAIFRATSLCSSGLLFDRASKIGGHEA